MLNYKIQLLSFGPFTIPKHDKWLIVGSGPSLDRSLINYEEYGIISLNSVQSILPKSYVSIFSHYEDVVNCWTHLDRSEIIFIANPLHVGYRCVPMKAFDLFNNEDFVRYLPNKVRFFEKESSLGAFFDRSHTLFCEHTIASAALCLLYSNGIKTVKTIGIDGGRGYSRRLKGLRDYNDEKMILPSYDNAYKEFHETAKVLGISVSSLNKNMEDIHAMRKVS